MTKSEAKELLMIHACDIASQDHKRAVTGFIGSLRPYEGKLNAENFNEIISALEVLEPELEKSFVDRDIIRPLWAICDTCRRWAIQPNGMLRTNRIISDAEAATLNDWIDCISGKVLKLLRGSVSPGIQESESLAPERPASPEGAPRKPKRGGG